MKTFDFKLGADPECSILFDGSRVSACDILGAMFPANKQIKNDAGVFGLDGCQATAELRPKAVNSPKEMVDNFQKLFAEFFKKGTAFDLSTLSLWAPVGGHIHLDWMHEMDDNHRQAISALLLPIAVSELRTDALIRLEGSYGKLSDCRIDDKEGGTTIELRGPTAQWLTTPKITEATFAYLGVVWEQLRKHPNEIPNKLLFGQDGVNSIQKLLYSGNTNFVSKGLEDMKKLIRSFDRYKDFEEEIEYIFNAKKVLADKKKAEFSINNGWGFRVNKDIKKREFLATPTKGSDIEGPWFAVNHNGDIGTALFADELKSRILSGYTLKNGYFIFGIKRPAEGQESGILVAQGKRLFITPPIKDQQDLGRVQRCARRIEEKIHVHDKIRIDFKNEKIVRERPRPFLIGLPREMRDAKDTKTFMEIIYKIEKGLLNPISPSTWRELPAGNDKGVDEEMDEKKVVCDEDSQGRRFAMEALSRLPSSLVASAPNEDDPKVRLLRRILRSSSIVSIPINDNRDIDVFLLGINTVTKKFVVFCEDPVLEIIRNRIPDTFSNLPPELREKFPESFLENFFEVPSLRLFSLHRVHHGMPVRVNSDLFPYENYTFTYPRFSFSFFDDRFRDIHTSIPSRRDWIRERDELSINEMGNIVLKRTLENGEIREVSFALPTSTMNGGTVAAWSTCVDQTLNSFNGST